jgi:hypothetical protein
LRKVGILFVIDCTGADILLFSLSDNSASSISYSPFFCSDHPSFLKFWLLCLSDFFSFSDFWFLSYGDMKTCSIYY